MKISAVFLLALFAALPAFADNLPGSVSQALEQEITAQAGNKLMPWEQNSISRKAIVHVAVDYFAQNRLGPQEPDYAICEGLIITPNGWLLLSKNCLSAIENKGRFISLSFSFPRNAGRFGNTIFYRDTHITRNSFKVDGNYALYKINDYVEVPTPNRYRGAKRSEFLSTAQIISQKMYLQKIFTDNEQINDDFRVLFGQHPTEELKSFVQKTVGQKRFADLCAQPAQ